MIYRVGQNDRCEAVARTDVRLSRSNSTRARRTVTPDPRTHHSWLLHEQTALRSIFLTPGDEALSLSCWRTLRLRR